MDNNSNLRHRREFLRFLAASPLMAEALSRNAFGQGTPPGPPTFPIKSAKDALSINDLEALAREALPPAHWGFMASGVDDNATIAANINAYSHIELRPRRLVDVAKIDSSIELFGTKWESPIFLDPVGEQRAFHPEGELATARAAKAKNTLQILSSATTFPVEEVAKARGTAPWYQLYIPAKFEDTEKLINRIQEAGCPAVAWTVDNLTGRNLETAERFRRIDTRQCTDCHTSSRGGGNVSPMSMGLSSRATNPLDASWNLFDKLRKITKVKLLIKGLETAADAKLAKEHGVDGIIVSNHGGRATETLRPTIESLPEIVDAVGNQIPVLVDGGIRRGSSVFKALAMGARAVGVGRPYVWGLASFGQDGVEHVIDTLRAELIRTMRQCGTPTIAQITRASVTYTRGA